MTAPRVYLVGAGPGSAGLLTLRGAECLQRADFVLYDQLVARRLLAFAPRAEKVCVSELAPTHPERCPHVHQRMIDEARQGKVVVRLKGGDPLVFGRGGEEAESLRRAGVSFEIVPGVTAALGAAAYAGIPLTHRRHASAVAFVTGHEDPAKPDSLLDWPALARFPGTLVFYMGLNRLEQLSRSLIEHGKDGATPAAIVEYATLGRQRTIEAPLAQLPEAARAAGVQSPALTIVGSVVSLRAQVAWLESRPLFNRRVVVTRPAGQDADLMRRLEELGADVFSQPTVAISEPDDWRPADDALARLGEYHWVVFTSVNGVHYFVRRLRQIGRDLRALGTVKLAAIGPATADALRGYHLDPDLVPESYRSEDLAAALAPRVGGQRVLLARADRGREILREQLALTARVEQVAVYSQKDLLEADPEILALLQNGEIEYLVLTSANIARSLARMLNDAARAVLTAARTRLVTISPVTSTAVRELGWPVAVEATVYTTEGVLEALTRDATAARRLH